MQVQKQLLRAFGISLLISTSWIYRNRGYFLYILKVSACAVAFATDLINKYEIPPYFNEINQKFDSIYFFQGGFSGTVSNQVRFKMLMRPP